MRHTVGGGGFATAYESSATMSPTCNAQARPPQSSDTVEFPHDAPKDAEVPHLRVGIERRHRTAAAD
jgi:hypothetical protein